MNSRIAFTGIFCFALVLLLAGAPVRDLPYIRSDTGSYLRLGEDVISWIFSGEPTFEQLYGKLRFPYYAISSMLLSVVYTVQGAFGVVVLNSVLFSITTCLIIWFWTSVYGVWNRTWGRDGFLLGAAGGLYVVFGLPDGFLWSHAILTDIIFLFWVAVFVIAVTKGILAGGRCWWIVAFIMASTAPLVRPTGMLLPVILIYAMGLVWVYRKGVTVKTIVLVSVGLTSVLAFVVFPWVVLMLMNKRFFAEGVAGSLERYLGWTVMFFRHGIVIKTRVELNLDSAPTYIDIVRMMCHRLLYYWIPLRFGERPYSFMHNAVNLVYITVVLPMFFVGVYRLFRSRNFALVTLFLLMVGYAFALMHAMTLVGFDWRYQLPAMVPFWMLAGCGLYSLLGYSMRDEPHNAGTRVGR